jgi:hypothetical protein
MNQNLDILGSDSFFSSPAEQHQNEAEQDRLMLEAYHQNDPNASIDFRIRQLSYSSLLTLHSCPRKFQLYRLQATRADQDSATSVTFAYGHVVGAGIQHVLLGMDRNDWMLAAFLAWDCPLDDIGNPKHNKSFYKAIIAIQKFQHLFNLHLAEEYELVYTDYGPAIELGFSIALPNGFTFRGSVDAVLRHKITGKIIVLECKTTSNANVTGAEYKNSAQAVGYSIVLDALFPGLSSYEVLYLVYQTKDMEYTMLPFGKSFLQRALWIQELLLDVETIMLYELANVYPMHGESCISFFRECEYYTTCTLSTEFLTAPLSGKDIRKIQADNARYHIKLSIKDLIAAQLSKSS